MAKDRKDSDIRPHVQFKGYDYTGEVGRTDTSPGGSLFHGPMDRFKSVKEFLEKSRKKRRQKKLAELLEKAAEEKDYKELLKINIHELKKTNPMKPGELEREYYEALYQMAKNGPIFYKDSLSLILDLKDDFIPTYNRKQFVKWLANYVQDMNLGRIQINREFSDQLNLVKDFINQTKFDVEKAGEWQELVDLAKEWHESEFYDKQETGGYKTKNVIYDFGNGFTIVKVPPEDLEVEGIRMQHCVSGYCDYVSQGGTEIYSLRDAQNKPHATVEVKLGKKYISKEKEQELHFEERLPGDSDYLIPKEIIQIKGKQNAAPAQKYVGMIKEWIEKSFKKEEYQDNFDYVYMLPIEDLVDMADSAEVLKVSPAISALEHMVTSDSLEEIINKLIQLHNKNKPLDSVFSILASERNFNWAEGFFKNIFAPAYKEIPGIDAVKKQFIIWLSVHDPVMAVYSHDIPYLQFKDLIKPIILKILNSYLNSESIAGFGDVTDSELEFILFKYLPKSELSDFKEYIKLIYDKKISSGDKWPDYDFKHYIMNWVAEFYGDEALKDRYFAG